MIVKDLQPFSIVEDAGFKAFVAILDPSYVLPSRPMLTRTFLPQIFETCAEKVQHILNASETITLKTDTWTSLATESYMAVTAHFISKEFGFLLTHNFSKITPSPRLLSCWFDKWQHICAGYRLLFSVHLVLQK